ncbi:hydrophobin [Trichoderma chlorosporum]
MKFFAVTALFATIILANVCPQDPFTAPQCCDIDELGIADLGCAAPTSPFDDLATFIAVCTSQGKRAACCVLPVGGLASILCVPPAETA